MEWKRKLLACVVIVLGISMMGASEAQAQTAYQAELEAAINYYFGGDAPVAHAIVECESGYGEDLLNEYSGAYGPWQFLPSTSYGMGYEHGYMDDPWYSTAAAYDYYLQAGFAPWACAY